MQVAENLVIIINLCLYVGLSLFCWIQYKWHNLSTIVSVLYVIGATFSVLLYFSPLYGMTYSSKGVCTLQACLYLFLVNFLLITSLCRCDIDKCKKLVRYNGQILWDIQCLLCIMLGVYLLFVIPDSVRKFFSGRDLAEMRDELYGTNTTGQSFVIALIGRIFGATPILLLGIVSIRIFLLKRMNVVDVISVCLYFLFKMSTVFSAVSRATIVFSFMELAIVFFFFHAYISRRVKIIIAVSTLIVIPLIYSIFSMITDARFGEGDRMEQEMATFRYCGEANLNFMALEYPDLNEPFWGYKQFPLFRRLLGLPYDDGTTREGVTVFDTYIMDYYKYPNPTYIFHGLAGTIYFNVGFWGCLIVAALMNVMLRYSFWSTRRVSVMQVIMSIILAAYIGKGIFYGEYASESGNFLIVFLVLLTLFLNKFGYTKRFVGGRVRKKSLHHKRKELPEKTE